MATVVWLGSVEDARQVAAELALHGVELRVAVDVEVAVELAAAHAAAAVLVALHGEELVSAVRQLADARGDLHVVVGTRQGLPEYVAAALAAGAAGVFDMNGVAHVVAVVDRSLARHRRLLRERDLLARLHLLNEEFLRAMVAMDRRNMELEETLQGDAGAGDGPVRVLVIDDEASLATLFAMVLTEHGYSVVTADSAERGLLAFRTQFFHVVVTDKNLPGADGLAVLREVKQARPETDVVMITAYGSKESAIAALNAGASAYLEKPFDDIEDVARKLEEVVQARRESERKRQFLRLFKERNREFLRQYRGIRAELEAWLGDVKEDARGSGDPPGGAL